MKPNLSVRRKKLMQEDARRKLWRFIWTVQHCMPQQSKHFQDVILGLNLFGRGPAPSEEAARFANGFLQILEKTAKNLPLAEADFEVLKNALNRPIRSFGLIEGYDDLAYSWNPEEITYSKVTRYIFEDSGPYEPKTNDRIRAAAQCLWEYLNLIHKSGPMHGLCRIPSCEALMTTGRGKKQFCSQKCRQSYWSYPEKREYFLLKQRQNRKTKARRKTKIVLKNPGTKQIPKL
jgi:hypothetical protein